MISQYSNPFRGRGLPGVPADRVCADPSAARALYAACPRAHETPLHTCADLAGGAGLGALWVKDERTRLGLGSFKALGAVYEIVSRAVARCPAAAANLADSLAGEVFVTASAGNHGLSVAAGARLTGARAVIVLSREVPGAFADRLTALGAEVRRHGDDYDESLTAARDCAGREGWTLLSDTTTADDDSGLGIMEGYGILADEIVRRCREVPDHVCLQAGVGGFAAGVSAVLRRAWGEGFRLLVVEPAGAPALSASIRAGRPVVAPGGGSIMGRLDCREPSLWALGTLAAQADAFVTLDDDDVLAALPALAAAGLETSASGGAGLAAVMLARREGLCGLAPDSRVLCVLTEGAVEDNR